MEELDVEDRLACLRKGKRGARLWELVDALMRPEMAQVIRIDLPGAPGSKFVWRSEVRGGVRRSVKECGRDDVWDVWGVRLYCCRRRIRPSLGDASGGAPEEGPFIARRLDAFVPVVA